MCGIFSFVNLLKDKIRTNQMINLFRDFNELKHRGPDNSYFETYSNVVVGFHRLSIVDDTFNSNQPFILNDEDGDRTIVFICNGEIYNFKNIIETFHLDEKIKSDCMVIPQLYLKIRKEDDFISFVRNVVIGEFAFLLFDFKFKKLTNLIVCRDSVGIRPLYFHPYKDDVSECLFFTSELKGALNFKKEIIEFPPGNLFNYKFDKDENLYKIMFNKIKSYSTPSPILLTNNLQNEYISLMLKNVYDSVSKAIEIRLNADKPFAFLLSGGVDSSIVASIASRILKDRNYDNKIKTFCCGIKDDSNRNEKQDLTFARMVANHINSEHTEVLFTPEEALKCIPDVIRTVESWDTTTIRASVGQYLVSKYISENTDCKVVMVGEGPDEVCSSYLFNWYAPNSEALDMASRESIENIHYYDIKRADRCISRWGLEGRVPFLDPEFIKAYWSIPSLLRMPTFKRIEKWWLREAFNKCNFLPEKVLWRKKEAFSDGISGEKSWFEIIQEWVENKVTNEELQNSKMKYPYCTPTTKEAYYYRRIFCEIFGEHRQRVIPNYWQPKWNSNGEEISTYVDPSARTLSVYK
jgi:asparagine synthase (glutamine-hydrolysing)